MKSNFILLLIISNIFVSFQETPRKKLTFENLTSELKGKPMKTLSVAGADGPEVLKAIRSAKDKKIANSILFGDQEKIKSTAQSLNIDISDFEIRHIDDPSQVAKAAVKIVHDGEADIYMKGTVNTKDLLKAILDKKVGLRTGKPLSTVAVFEIPNMHQMLFISDPAVMVYPTLEDKIKMIEGAVEVAHSTGILEPKVAALAAVEEVNTKMIDTIEAKALSDMNDRGEIKDCIVDGPLSMDLAIDPFAAHLKGKENRKIHGDADVLLCPNISSANVVYKMLTHLADSKSGNIVVGTSAPVILTSRSDTFATKLNSMVLAVHYSEYLRKNNINM